MLTLDRLKLFPATVVLLSMFLSSCSSGLVSKTTPTNSANLSDQALENAGPVSELKEVLPELARFRVVLIGEQHDRFDHHTLQLDIINYLQAQDTPIAIGLEFFQQPYQSILDAYVASTIDEQQMLEQVEYFKRWGYDYRLYAPILRFARQHTIPLIALNIPGEIIRKTSRKGLASLSKRELQFVPKEIDRSVVGYNSRIKASFDAHDGIAPGMFDNFIDAQLLWDEGMAQAAANYLRTQPERRLVILAGNGHIEYRTGIPTRLERRIMVPVTTVLPVSRDDKPDALRADYHIETTEIALPKTGLIGVMLDESEYGVFAQSFTEYSAGEKAGLLVGDFFRSINSVSIRRISDIKLALWDAKPGETINLTVERRNHGSNRSLDFKLTLH